MKHTKWELVKGLHRYTSPPREVAKVVGVTQWIDINDATLVSKAPEMYEALKTIRDAFWSEGEKPKEQVKDLKSIAESLLKEIES